MKLFENINGNTFKLASVKEEQESDQDVLYVEYVRDMPSEKPFTLKTPNGTEKFEFVIAKYPSGKEDIAVYAYRGDLVYGYGAFRKRYNLS